MLTSYYGKTKSTVPGAICISRTQPRWNKIRYPEYKLLAPGKWYRTAEVEDYIPLYNDEILGQLDAQQVHDDLYRIAHEHARALGVPEKEISSVRPILLCYEKPSDFCHRRLAANWLESALDIDVPEGYLDAGSGKYVTIPGWEQGGDQTFDHAIGHDAKQQMAAAREQLNFLDQL